MDTNLCFNTMTDRVCFYVIERPLVTTTRNNNSLSLDSFVIVEPQSTSQIVNEFYPVPVTTPGVQNPFPLPVNRPLVPQPIFMYGQ